MSKAAAKHASTGKRARTETAAPTVAEPKKLAGKRARAETESSAPELEEPKKPTGGGYGAFLAKNRAEFTKQCAGQPVTAISKLAGTKWKAMSAAQKKPFEDEYKKKVEQYKKDLEAFAAKGGVVGKRKEEKKAKKAKKEGKTLKKKKDPNAPKQPAGGAYGCFLAKNRPQFAKECAGKPVTAISKLASEKWKALPAAQKKPFEEEFKKKQAAYQEAKKAYDAEKAKNGGGDEEEGEEEEDEDEDEDEDDDEDDEE